MVHSSRFHSSFVSCNTFLVFRMYNLFSLSDTLGMYQRRIWPEITESTCIQERISQARHKLCRTTFFHGRKLGRTFQLLPLTDMQPTICCEFQFWKFKFDLIRFYISNANQTGFKLLFSVDFPSLFTSILTCLPIKPLLAREKARYLLWHPREYINDWIFFQKLFQ